MITFAQCDVAIVAAPFRVGGEEMPGLTCFRFSGMGRSSTSPTFWPEPGQFLVRC
jgi:hypothetical protein